MPFPTVSALQTDLPFGARVTDLTSQSLEEEAVREKLRDVFEASGMIVFEGVEQSSEMQVKLSNVFGALKEHPVAAVSRADRDRLPGVIEITAGPEMCVVEIAGQQLVTWQPWHFDHSYNNELNRAGILRPIKITSSGGRTGFADGVQIYNDMAPHIREKIEGLTAIYSLDLRFKKQRYGLPEGFRVIKPHDNEILDIAYAMPRALHPIVWERSPGEKVVHVSPYGARGVEGMNDAAADTLLQEVWDEMIRVMRPYFHEWRATDMLIWDNWRMLHEAGGCPPGEDRVMHRTTIKGDYGYGRFEDKPQVAPAE